MAWFSVKLLYKVTITGQPEPDRIDEYYNKADGYFEESILLAEAESFDDAFAKAKKEALKNQDIYVNKYGQTVKIAFYDFIECYHLFDSPQSLTEVFWTCFKNTQENEKQIIADRYRSCSSDEMHPLRHY